MADSKKRPSLNMDAPTKQPSAAKKSDDKPSITKSKLENTQPKPSATPTPKSSTTPAVKSKGMVDVTNKTDVAKKTSAAVTTTSIELDNIVEHKGKYYRGVQVVEKELAKILQELDKKSSDNGRSVTGSSVVPGEPTSELPSSDNQTLSSSVKE